MHENEERKQRDEQNKTFTLSITISTGRFRVVEEDSCELKSKLYVDIVQMNPRRRG
jgi:hypothetical protein